MISGAGGVDDGGDAARWWRGDFYELDDGEGVRLAEIEIAIAVVDFVIVVPVLVVGFLKEDLLG